MVARFVVGLDESEIIQSLDLRVAIDKLPLCERRAVTKRLLDKPLTRAEREHLALAKVRLRNLLR